MFEFDKLDGSNQLFCDNCNSKTDTLKGYRLQRLPPILTLDLNRFDFDYNTLQRVKVNDKFEFPLELDVSAHLDPEAFEPLENCIYELKSVIIHRGGAYGGHYHAFIQDELKEGDWHLQMPEQFQKDPAVVSKKTFNPKDHMTEEQIKKLEDSKKDEGAALSLDVDMKETETKKESEPVPFIAEKPQGTLSKKDRKRLENQKKQEQKKEQQKTQQPKKNEKKAEDQVVEYDYDLCDFPIQYSEKRLIEGWFDFNDSCVSPILPGKLQSQFGNGSSGESAYILIYRQKKMCAEIAQANAKPNIPEYWKSYITEMNKLNQQQREVYAIFENQIEIVLQDQSLFNIDETSFFVSYKEDTNIDDQG